MEIVSQSLEGVGVEAPDIWATLLPRYRVWHAPALFAPAAGMLPHIRCGYADLRRQQSGTLRTSQLPY